MDRHEDRLDDPVAVIGGGWAGCTAAIELARRGHRVALYEAAPVLG
ncbi:MAG: FAD-dependent oxidoreductase, partial [Casimicrobiaceae bacterium]